MPQVNSSAINSIDYYADSRRLVVSFHETGTYAYEDVPQNVYDAFLEAPSKGQYFNDHIRDKYFRRL